MSKVTFSEAATAAGIHFNTLRNWRKSNKLTSAEKVLENGVEIWIVELSEVEQLARQSRHKRANNNKSSVDGSNPDLPPVDVPGPPGTANNNPNTVTTIAPGFDNFMALVERSQKPLLDQIGTLTSKVESLARENGELQERLRVMEAAQAPHLAQSGPQPATTGQITTQPVETPQNVPTPTPQPEPQPQTKRGWWARLLGS